MSSDDAILRGIIARERERQRAADAKPWESGVVDWDRVPRKPEDVLAERLHALDTSFQALCALLVERGVLEDRAVQARVAEWEQKRRELEAAAERAEHAAKKASEERTVSCVGCQAVVPARDSYVSGDGTLCNRCHVLREG